MPRDFVERIQNYMVKAVHEAKRHSSWINPNPDYDKAIREFVGLILDERSGQPFLDDFRAFQRQVSHLWPSQFAGQTLLKLAAARRRRHVSGHASSGISAWLTPTTAGRSTMRFARGCWATSKRAIADGARRSDAIMPGARRVQGRRANQALPALCALGARRDNPGLFTTGDYVRSKSTARRRRNLIAFSRGSGETQAFVATPRLWSRLARGASENGRNELSPTSSHPSDDSDAQSRQNSWRAGIGRISRAPRALGSTGSIHRLMLSGHANVLWMVQRFHRRGSHCRCDEASLSLPCADTFRPFSGRATLERSRLSQGHIKDNASIIKLVITSPAEGDARRLPFPSFLVCLKTLDF